jgi:phosphoglycolate phosphatase
MNKIFFDLDGTLIDSRKRLYSLFQDLVPQSKLTFDEYWKLKRSKIDHKKILTEQFEYNQKLFACFETAWLALIETEKYLKMDTIFDGVLETLDQLKQNYVLNLVTARQNVEIAHWQLKKMGLFDFFDNILVTEHKISKEELIIQHYQISNNDYFVGDTGYDISTGKKIGAKTIAVSYGFVSKEILVEYEPDLLIDNPNDIKNIL